MTNVSLVLILILVIVFISFFNFLKNHFYSYIILVID